MSLGYRLQNIKKSRKEETTLDSCFKQNHTENQMNNSLLSTISIHNSFFTNHCLGADLEEVDNRQA